MSVVAALSENISAKSRYLTLDPRALAQKVVGEPAKTLELQILELVDWMIHELATPLASLTISAEVLASSFETMEPDEAREALRRIHRNTFWLKALVDNFKQSVRASRTEPNFRLVDLSTCLETACSLVQPIIDSRGQTVLVGGMPDQPLVWGDCHWIEHILVNLLMNASKYSNKGGSIWLDIVEVENAFQVRVIDSGPGIRLHDQARIFRPYTRGAAAKRGGVEGMGLGLHVVKSLVEAQGGSVGVQSVLGRGSVFWVALPGYRRDETATPVTSALAGCAAASEQM